MEINTDPRDSSDLQLVDPESPKRLQEFQRQARGRRTKEVQDRKPSPTLDTRADEDQKRGIEALRNWQDHKPRY